MKNYAQSDYAANKHSDKIVYRCNGETVEIGLDEFLVSNPGMSERDFRRWKKYSDMYYLREVRALNNNTRKDVPISPSMDVSEPADLDPAPDVRPEMDTDAMMEVLRQALAGDLLTEKQKRRFTMHFIDGMTTREIGAVEGVSNVMAAKSINQAKKKIVKVFAKWVNRPLF